ncbi:MAG: signal peptidase I [Bdellovibrionaceae bacterium]|nr:signal peptidase I [Pseudobdellovibrionaceae bacterium]
MKFDSKEMKKLSLYVLVAFTVLWGVAEAYHIPTESMNPTLKPGDQIFVNKAQYGVRIPFTKRWLFHTGDVKRGDVVVFRYPVDESTFYVKRVIGLPGEQVYVNATGHVFINGVWQAEDYTAKKIGNSAVPLAPFGPVTVPANQLFVLGDNRGNSADSRVWGFLPKDHLMGKVAFKWFSWVD